MNTKRFLALSVFAFLSAASSLCFAAWNHLPAGKPWVGAFAANASEQRMFMNIGGSGFWQSENSGATWEGRNSRLIPFTRNVYVGGFNVVDAAGDTVILNANTYPLFSHIWYTHNGGNEWTHFPEDLANGSGDQILVLRQNHNLWFHISDSWLYRSSDAGQTWDPYDRTYFYAEQMAPLGFCQDPVRDSTLFRFGAYDYSSYNGGYQSGGIARSDDLGQTWRLIVNIHAMTGDTMCEVTGLERLPNGDLIASVYGYNSNYWPNGSIIVSTDDGATWQVMSSGLPNKFMPGQVVQDPEEPGTLFAVSSAEFRLHWSHDYGRSWTPCETGLPFQNYNYLQLSRNSFSNAIYVSLAGQGVFVTRDHGQSWQPLNMPSVGSAGQFGWCEETVFFQDYSSYTHWRLNPGSQTWSEVSTPVAQDTVIYMNPIIYKSHDTLVSVVSSWNLIGESSTQHRMAYSYDDGQHWQLGSDMEYWPDGVSVQLGVGHAPKLVAPSYNALLFSADLGHTWNRHMLPDSNHQTIYYPITLNDSAVYIVVENYDLRATQIFRTVDDGVTLQNLNFPGPFANLANVIPVLLGDELFVNVGATCWHWRQGVWDERGIIPADTDLTMLIVAPRDNRPVLFGLSNARTLAWFSDDSGFTWQTRTIEHPYNQQFAGFSDLKYDAAQHRIWAVSGVGTCYLDESELSVDGPLHFKPADFTLLSAYPNPFNSQTSIIYDLENAGKIKLSVFDLTGRLVNTLTDEMQTAGRHNFEFDGSSLASGTYFVRLQTPAVTRTVKTMLLK